MGYAMSDEPAQLGGNDGEQCSRETLPERGQHDGGRGHVRDRGESCKVV